MFVCLLVGIEIYRSNISMSLILNGNSIRLHMKFSQLATQSVSITFSMPVGSANWLITLDNNNIYNILMQRRVYIVFPNKSYSKEFVHLRSDTISMFGILLCCSDFPFSLHHAKREFLFSFSFFLLSFRI